MYAAPDNTEPRAPKSATAAARLPDYDAPFGWKAAIQKELDRVEGFDGWEVVSAEHVRRFQRKYPGRVSIGHVVGVLRQADAQHLPSECPQPGAWPAYHQRIRFAWSRDVAVAS